MIKMFNYLMGMLFFGFLSVIALINFYLGQHKEMNLIFLIISIGIFSLIYFLHIIGFSISRKKGK